MQILGGVSSKLVLKASLVLVWFFFAFARPVAAVPEVTLTTSPSSGQCLEAGSSYSIGWTKNAEVDHVALSYSLTGADAHDYSIGHPLSTSPFNWNVPSASSNNVKITLDGHNTGHSILDSDFSAIFKIDCTSPSQPGTPSTTSPTSDTTPTWSWGASTDNVAVSSYEVYWSQTPGGIDNSSTTASASFTHSAALANGTWYFKVRALDGAGNQSSFSANGSAVIDTTPPSAPGTPSASSPTSDNTPTWNWAASSGDLDHYFVYWSQTASGETNSANVGTGISFTHSTSLADGTWYLKVRAFDAVGNSSTSANGSVLVDTTGPTTPGNLRTTGVSHNRVDLAWDASTDTGSGLKEYKVFRDGALKSTQTTTTYSDTTVSASTAYTYDVRAYDTLGNQSAAATKAVTTSSAPGTPDTTAPGISSVSAGSIGETTVTISWTTNESATSQVEYGLTVSYGKSTLEDSNLKTSHSVSLSGLGGGATYHYRVKSKDAAGNLAASGDFTFKTQSPPDKQAPIVSSVTSNTYAADTQTVNVAWTTNEPATSQVEYGETQSLGQTTVEDGQLTTSHNVQLSSIAQERVYYFKVRSKDAAGNLAISALFSFDTQSAEPVRDESLASPTLEKLFFNNQEMAVDTIVLKVTKEDTFILVGKAFPFAKVKLYVFSEPRVYETSTNGEGSWMVTIAAADFEPGEHKVESEAETKENKLTRRKEIFRFEVIAAEEEMAPEPKEEFPAVALLLIPVAIAAAIFGALKLKKRLLPPPPPILP